MRLGEAKTAYNIARIAHKMLLGDFKMVPKFETYEDFFPYYLAEHSLPICRTLHYIGTSLAMIVIVYALYSQQYWMLLLSPLAGYSFAWFAHFVFEKNKPATFNYPLWSFISDYKMMGLWVTGKLGPAMEDAMNKHGRSNSKGVSGAR